jgi:hypothetical protein
VISFGETVFTSRTFAALFRPFLSWGSQEFTPAGFLAVITRCRTQPRHGLWFFAGGIVLSGGMQIVWRGAILWPYAKAIA